MTNTDRIFRRVRQVVPPAAAGILATLLLPASGALAAAVPSPVPNHIGVTGSLKINLVINPKYCEVVDAPYQLAMEAWSSNPKASTPVWQIYISEPSAQDPQASPAEATFRYKTLSYYYLAPMSKLLSGGITPVKVNSFAYGNIDLVLRGAGRTNKGSITVRGTWKCT